jgi:hypothetical protein
MESLEDFSIFLLGRKPGGTVLANVLSNLRHDTVRSLTIGGSYRDLQPNEKVSLLQPLKGSLRVLRLRCSNFVDDSLLRFILEEMTQLIELELAEVQWTSLDESADESRRGYSLKNLSGPYSV